MLDTSLEDSIRPVLIALAIQLDSGVAPCVVTLVLVASSLAIAPIVATFFGAADAVLGEQEYVAKVSDIFSAFGVWAIFSSTLDSKELKAKSDNRFVKNKRYK